MLGEWNTSQLADYDTAPASADVVNNADGSVSYTLRARKYSHWFLDDNEEYVFLAPNKIKTQDKWYAFDKRFSSRDTAYIIMDPWSNMACDFLNDHLGGLTDETVVPMAQAAAESGHKVIILTDLPNQPYNSKIAPKLQAMVDEGKAQIIYHNECNAEKLSKLLSEQGIKNLVYSGFFSNMCTLLRPMGIFKMVERGEFNVYFVPKASAAMEHSTTWNTQLVHHASTLLISQTQAMLLELDDIINAMK